MPKELTKNREVPRKPSWLKIKLPKGENYSLIKGYQQHFGLQTVCKESNCPNLGECWDSGTATFMLMGDYCTRSCGFCSVKTAKNPPPLDPQEPRALAETIKKLKLRYVVLTSVDRDDLVDGGAEHFVKTVEQIHLVDSELKVELLLPDFSGNQKSLDKVLDSGASVLAHNLETVRRLSAKVRDHKADYDRSLSLLKYLKSQKPKGITKSSLMLGLGETEDEIKQSMEDLLDAGVDLLTLGQYLQPAKNKLKVVRYLEPSEFEQLRDQALGMGFRHVASGPLVRSSYRASLHYFDSLKTTS